MDFQAKRGPRKKLRLNPTEKLLKLEIAYRIKICWILCCWNWIAPGLGNYLPNKVYWILRCWIELPVDLEIAYYLLDVTLLKLINSTPVR